MSTHDPFHPQTRHANRAFVEPPPDPTNDVPGHEDEAIDWMLAPVLLDAGVELTDEHLAELVRRTDLVETAEYARPGTMRDRILFAVGAVRGAHGATQPGLIGPNVDGAAARFADLALSLHGATADPEAESPSPERHAEMAAAVDATEVDDRDGPVPEKAADVVKWIAAGTNDANKARRAQRAWAAECDRTDGVRATVQAEVDKYLAP